MAESCSWVGLFFRVKLFQTLWERSENSSRKGAKGRNSHRNSRKLPRGDDFFCRASFCPYLCIVNQTKRDLRDMTTALFDLMITQLNIHTRTVKQ